MHAIQSYPLVFRYWYGLFLFVLLTACGGPVEPPTPATWKLTANSSTVYLMGSVHVGRPTFYPLSAEVEAAYQQAEHLAVEVNILDLDTERYRSQIEQAQLEAPGGKKNVSTKFANKIKDALFTRRIPEEYYDKYKFWYLFELLTPKSLPQGISAGYGVDVHFLKRAKTDNKTILELESVETQLNMLVRLGQDDPELYYNYLTDPEQRNMSIFAVIDLWKQGDPAALAESIFLPLKKNPSYAPIYDKLFFERNVNMVKGIEAYFKTNKTYFVLVGAGHLVGSKGIPALLKQKGYNIQQLAFGK